jgi:hypothetical protein
MWKYSDNQEVGLEAAILQRVRNSSLVKCFCAENLTGLKPVTEAMGPRRKSGAVGEHSLRIEALLQNRVDYREEIMPA